MSWDHINPRPAGKPSWRTVDPADHLLRPDLFATWKAKRVYWFSASWCVLDPYLEVLARRLWLSRAWLDFEREGAS